MKIAIVGPGFTGATLPLAQHIYKMGYQIDCFYVTRIGLSSIESLDFDEPLNGKKNLFKIPLSNRLYEYLDNGIGVYVAPMYKRHKRLERLLIGLPYKWANYFKTRIFIKSLLKSQYDRIILIDQFDNEQIGKALLKAGTRFVTSYHEVLESLTGKPVVRKKVIDSLSLGRPAILHSEKTKQDLLFYSGVKDIESRTTVIKFGPFESLWQYGDGRAIKDVEDGFFLFLGRITQYKGLGVLYEASKFLKDNENIKVVVAGSGNDPIKDEIKKDSRFVLINRFIANDEMVWLTSHCKAIVCPYIAASQSGLMSLAFAYNKPIIATKVGAFPEFIVDGVTGYLSENVTGESFAEAMQRCIDEDGSFTGSPLPKSIRWDYIAKQVLGLLEKI